MLGSPTHLRRLLNRFLFHWRGGIPNGQALEQVLPQKTLNPTHAFILHRVNQLVKDQPPVAPAVHPDENSVAQSQTGCVGRDEVHRIGGGGQRQLFLSSATIIICQ